MAGAPGGGVAPFGGAKGAFGTNPISFGLPAGEMPPVMVDYATSAVAGGKISLSRAKGSPCQPNSILDKEGNPSTNPEDFYEGGVVLPFGGHKGTGWPWRLRYWARRSPVLMSSPVRSRGGSYKKAGSVFIAIDPASFRPMEGYSSAVDATIRRIKSVPPAPGVDEVLLPGEPERRTRESRLQEGISMPDSSWKDLQELAAKYGVDPHAVLGKTGV